jgi:hypothetical protein
MLIFVMCPLQFASLVRYCQVHKLQPMPQPTAAQEALHLRSIVAYHFRHMLAVDEVDTLLRLKRPSLEERGTAGRLDPPHP